MMARTKHGWEAKLTPAEQRKAHAVAARERFLKPLWGCVGCGTKVHERDRAGHLGRCPKSATQDPDQGFAPLGAP